MASQCGLWAAASAVLQMSKWLFHRGETQKGERESLQPRVQFLPVILIRTSARQGSDSQSVRPQIGNTSVTWKCGENANRLFPSIFTFTCILLFSEAYGTNLLCDSFLSILRQKLDLMFTVL